MNAWRASANDAVAMPTSSTPMASTNGFGESSATTRPSSAAVADHSIAFRSPMRATIHPLGRSPISWPRVMHAAIRPARASEAPRCTAATGMIGMIAPSPVANSSDGR